MKKYRKIGIVFIIILSLLIFGFHSIWIESYKITNIENYNQCFSNNSKYMQRYNKSFGNSSNTNINIFPKTIPGSAKVKDFCYYYYNSFDPNFLFYLVYTCNEEDFTKEIKRLKKVYSCKDYFIYGATGFNYPISAVSAGDNGYIYALADKENNKLIYVGINFCNYFSDIDYEKIIDKKHLPINFNANKKNSVYKKKNEEIMKKWKSDEKSR